MSPKKTPLMIRINILFFLVFILFSLLILRLGIIQIVHGEDYQREINRKENYAVHNPVPRGRMLDRDYRIVVDNEAKKAITYTNEGHDQNQKLKIAEELAKLIDKETDHIRERDKKDYWILKNPDRAENLISAEERKLFKEKKLTDEQIYQRKLDRITKKELEEFKKEDLEELAIFRLLNIGTRFSPQIIKNENVTREEFAAVSEHLEKLPGINTTIDWERTYLYDKTIRSLLGAVSSTEEGLPADQLDTFLSRGYRRNERVGKSYLENQYEDILHGKDEKTIHITDKKGHLLQTETTYSGDRGKDIVLAIDMELQKKVDKIIEEELLSAKKKQGTHLLDRAYVVLMDPYTGEVLTMSGKRIITDKETGKREIIDDALGNITTTYNVGSTVKGATILTGYKTGAIHPRTFFDDKGLKIKGTPVKASYAYLGVLNEVDALKKSSNVYMFHTAIKIGNGQYQYNEPIDLDDNVFDTIRNSFASFGLGVRTGIDLPNEQSGYQGTSRLPGYALDLVIGQYDTYSTMQLAQYVSAIANGGYRIQPRMVKEILEPEVALGEKGPVYFSFKPKVLNTIDVKTEWLQRVQLGFKKALTEHGGTGYNFFGSAPYSPAGKTGTAEAFYDGPLRNKYGRIPPEVLNLSLVAYAPSHSPKVAMAVMVPWAFQGKEDHKANLRIGRRVLDVYFQN
ncbi:penicillin-binding protein 2 [Mesobacillus maritimus]|uniref:peptidoglycan D,D-transpeptidase FtsI family protein n=1 Tax=Mesobacillus maritimus TaxID=1643336 RepID=UPI00203E0D93|nr:penicillin-binding protein 2 [Mesobacillus maritimus]MCM3584141.1 penicillin-binding protein 2 [Mesobacillus maritimus]MCM3669397.1 penicillin-binding protein 2 [Mesobacillus maritimus]